MRFRAFCAVLLCACMLGAPFAVNAQDKSGSTSSETVKKEMTETIERTKEQAEEKREELVEDVRTSLDKFDDWYHERMVSLKENWAKLSDEGRDRLADASKELRERRHDMSEWLGKLQETAKATWDDTKAEFNKAYAKFKDAWDKHDDEAKEAGVEKKSE